MADYRFGVVRTAGRPPADVVSELRAMRPWLALAGGPGIGFASDEFAVVTSNGELGAPTSDPVEHLVPTARPTVPQSPELDGGVVALRHFDVGEGDAPEFVELSASAWPAFEELYEARILGLFRVLDVAAGSARFLLATWYGSFAEWERSRGLVRAQGEDAVDATRRFQRRQQLTRRTIVRVGIPVPTT